MAYCSLAQVRAIEPLASDESTYTDAMILEGLLWAEQRIDQITGTSWAYKATTVTLDGNNKSYLWTGVKNLRTVTSCTIDGTAQTVDDWVVTLDGYVRRDSGYFTFTWPGKNVSLSLTAGATSWVPDDIAWAAKILAVYYVLKLVSTIPDNTIQIVTEGGTVMLAQPGKYGPTALPEVNAVLEARSHKAPRIG